MNQVTFKKFNSNEHHTWQLLFERLKAQRDQHIVPLFSDGLHALKIKANQIPDLSAVNARLKSLTGWESIAVEGLEDGASFFNMIANKKFPIGNFIRNENDLSYTPAPDVFHDLYGHIPFYTNVSYAQFCEEFGRRAKLYSANAEILREFERFFWFTIEFGLIETSNGRQIFGAGIASSLGECEYALSNQPQVIPFDVELIRRQEFRIDVFQEKLFVLKSVEQLYSSLDEFTAKYAR